MKIKWAACFAILVVAILWKLGFKLLGWNETAGFITSFLVSLMLVISLEVIEIE